ncbi:probable tetracycline resistance protein [Paenibacillus vortex V453]|uniref:Probable tetracycline resistance protein n=2 Tax=Paenibacillus TaxID=44249 RepID=A0A2R9SP45_9BACL|nr:hypothetical protein B9D94_06940 [Paenibacillus sp. Cedars]EFU39123.1 probable tetracycline resistance protein [Paenibacillus vortex V453]
MVNFIAQGMAIGIYGKMTDLSRSAIPAWNPLFGSPATQGLIFSNIWLVLAVLQVASLGLFYFVFGRRCRAESSETWLITA